MREDRPFAPVSVIIPCYNCARSLERAVTSVALQTVKPAEVILVDDASTDNTRFVMEDIRKRFGKQWLRVICLGVNSGPATARNVGWEHAQQDLVAFLDADDAWHEEKVRIQCEFMNKNEGVALSGHRYRIISNNKTDDEAPNQGGPVTLDCRSLLKSNRLATRTVMLRRNLPYRFPEGGRYCEDYHLWLEVVCQGYSAVLLPHELAYAYKADFGEGGLSSRLWRMERGELSAIRNIAQKDAISPVVATIASVYSLLKYLRREIVVKMKLLTTRFVD